MIVLTRSIGHVFKRLAACFVCLCWFLWRRFCVCVLGCVWFFVCLGFCCLLCVKRFCFTSVHVGMLFLVSCRSECMLSFRFLGWFDAFVFSLLAVVNGLPIHINFYRIVCVVDLLVLLMFRLLFDCVSLRQVERLI